MNWEVLIIPLIALGVWILSTIFRTFEEARELERPRGGAVGDNKPSGAPKRTGNELDRFLEEARKRREPPVTKRRPEKAPAASPLDPAPVETPLPPKRSEPVRIVRRGGEASRRRVEPAAPAAAPVPREPVKVELPEVPPPVTPATMPRPAGSPLIKRVLGMLNDREGVKVAFLLREILDRPVGQRGR